MEYSLQNLEKIVQKKADDNFIKSIIRKYINIDMNQCRNLDVSDLLYAALRTDENSVGKINEEDKRKFAYEVKKDFISRYGVPQKNLLKEQYGWFTYKSWKLLGTDRIDHISHRLYINSKASNLMALSNAIYDELKKRKIPFYFKIQGNENNGKGYKDSIVLYTSTQLLDDTIKAIFEIEKNNPSLIENCNNPSEIVGHINSYLGYAFESDNPKYSYTNLICKSFENGIENTVKEWCLYNPNATIGSQNIKDYYLSGMDYFDDFKKKTQKLVYTIPKVDKGFVSTLCNNIRNEMVKLGIDPNNICMDIKTSSDIKSFCASGLKSELSPEDMSKDEITTIFDDDDYEPVRDTEPNAFEIDDEDEYESAFEQEREPNAFEIDDEDEYENAFEQEREPNAFEIDDEDEYESTFEQEREPNAFEIDDEDEYENAFKQKRELNAFDYDELDYLKEQRRKLEKVKKQENTNTIHR